MEPGQPWPLALLLLLAPAVQGLRAVQRLRLLPWGEAVDLATEEPPGWERTAAEVVANSNATVIASVLMDRPGDSTALMPPLRPMRAEATNTNWKGAANTVVNLEYENNSSSTASRLSRRRSNSSSHKNGGKTSSPRHIQSSSKSHGKSSSQSHSKSSSSKRSATSRSGSTSSNHGTSKSSKADASSRSSSRKGGSNGRTSSTSSSGVSLPKMRRIRRPHPSPKPPAKPMRVAVCAVGHVRSFVLPGVHSSLLINVFDSAPPGSQVDLFFVGHLDSATFTKWGRTAKQELRSYLFNKEQNLQNLTLKKESEASAAQQARADNGTQAHALPVLLQLGGNVSEGPQNSQADQDPGRPRRGRKLQTDNETKKRTELRERREQEYRSRRLQADNETKKRNELRERRELEYRNRTRGSGMRLNQEQTRDAHMQELIEKELEEALDSFGSRLKYVELHNHSDCPEMEATWREEGVERVCPENQKTDTYLQIMWIDHCLRVTQQMGKYDLVIRTRPDVGVFAPIRWEDIDDTHVNFMRKDSKGRYDAFFTIPTGKPQWRRWWSEVMDRYNTSQTRLLPDYTIFFPNETNATMRAVSFPAAFVRSAYNVECWRIIDSANDRALCEQLTNQGYFLQDHTAEQKLSQNLTLTMGQVVFQNRSLLVGQNSSDNSSQDLALPMG